MATPNQATAPKSKESRGLPETLPGPMNPGTQPLSDFTELRFFSNKRQAHLVLQARWEKITPDYARYIWNHLNKTNRRARPKAANALAKRMLQDEFGPNGQTLIFDSNGDLQDGQHRIYGSAKSNTAFIALVVRGAAPDNFVDLDRGTIRNTADTLSVIGVTHAAQVASVARRVKQYEKSNYVSGRGGTSIPNEEIPSFISDRPQIVKSVNFVGRTVGGARLITPSALAFVHYVCSGYSQEMADEFVNLIKAPGVNLIGVGKTAEPVKHLRVRLDRMADKKKNNSVTPPEAQIVGLALAAWNAFCVNGRKMTKKLQAPKKKGDKAQYSLPPKPLRSPTVEAFNSVRQVKQRMTLLAQVAGQ